MSDIFIAKNWAIGDIVYPRAEAGWKPDAIRTKCKITNVPKGRNQVNFTAMPVDDEGNLIPGALGFKGRPNAFTDEVPAVAHEVGGATVTVFVPNAPIASLVRPATGTQIPEGVYVVTGHVDHERVRIQRIGGDGGRYWRVYSRTLTLIDASGAEQALAEAGL